MNSKWLIDLKPLPDELLGSWLIRTAVINGDDPVGWTLKYWNKWRAWTTDLDRQCPPEKIKELSKASGLSETQLSSMTLKPTIEKLIEIENLNSAMRWPWVIPNGKRNRTAINGLHFCSDCLSVDPIYFRKSWRVAWNVACPTHKTLLSISCPECNTVISPHLITYDDTELYKCTHCGNDLKKIITNKASDEVIQFQELLNHSLINNEAFRHNDERNKLIPLGIATNIELFAATLFLMKFFYSLKRYKKSYQYLIDSLGLTEENKNCPSASGGVVETLPVQFRHFLLLAVTRLLSLEKEDIVQLLQDAEVSQQRFSLGGSVTGFIAEIQTELNDKPLKRKTRIVHQEVIFPRSEQEVERLMDEEIRPYL